MVALDKMCDRNRHIHRRVTFALLHLLFHMFDTYILPTGHTRRIDRQLVFKPLHAAKVLPIWIFDPCCDNIAIAEVMGVLVDSAKQPSTEY